MISVIQLPLGLSVFAFLFICLQIPVQKGRKRTKLGLMGYVPGPPPPPIRYVTKVFWPKDPNKK